MYRHTCVCLLLCQLGNCILVFLPGLKEIEDLAAIMDEENHAYMSYRSPYEQQQMDMSQTLTFDKKMEIMLLHSLIDEQMKVSGRRFIFMHIMMSAVLYD